MNETAVKEAIASFESLLREQVIRSEAMKHNSAPVIFTPTTPVVIGVAEGDGIGPTIVASARKVLELLLRDEIAAGSVTIRRIDGLTLENRQKSGAAVPDEVMASVRNCDVLLKGPTTTPKGGAMESANVVLRRELDLFANIRPVTVKSENIDWIFFRENTEGEYPLGARGIRIDNDLFMDFKVTTDAGTRRIAHAAFRYAMQNGKKKVAIVTKANIMKQTDGAFSRICHEVAEMYPDISAEDWYIDIMTANLVNSAIRSQFEVFLLPNLYGDIITDEAAQIQGGVGTAGSANIGDRFAMFEAIHGSAPRLVEEGLAHTANPQSILKACAMLLRHISRTGAADRLDTALDTFPFAEEDTTEGYTSRLTAALTAEQDSDVLLTR